MSGKFARSKQTVAPVTIAAMINALEGARTEQARCGRRSSSVEATIAEAYSEMP
jgi:hypothetical protein